MMRSLLSDETKSNFCLKTLINLKFGHFERVRSDGHRGNSFGKQLSLLEDPVLGLILESEVQRWTLRSDGIN